MREKYIKPLIEVVEILNDEIITTSPNTEYSGGTELPSDVDFD